MKLITYKSLIIVFMWYASTHPISVPDFLKLPPAKKVQEHANLSQKDRTKMAKNNFDRLTGTTAKKNGSNVKECVGCYLENITLSGDQAGTILTGAVLNNVKIKSCNLKNSNMTGCLLIGCEISDSDLSEVIADDLTITGLNPTAKPTILSNSNLSKAKLNRAHIHAEFSGVNGRELEAVGTTLRLSKFDGATTLEKANLQFLDAHLVEFNQTNLTGTDFRNSLLNDVSFYGSTLTQALFNNATILFAQFADTQADGMHLEGTNFLYGVSFKGANLSKSSTSADTNWKGAQFCQTIMPQAKTEQNKQVPIINNDDCGKPSILHEWQKDYQDVEKNKFRLTQAKQCINCYLDGVDLRGLDLTNAQLQGSWMTKANLIGTKLVNSNLKGANLSTAITNESTNFSGAYLCKTHMPEKMYPTQSNFRNDNCNQAPPASAYVEPAPQVAASKANKETLLKTKSCPGCDLSYVILERTASGPINLNKGDLSGANLIGAKFDEVSLDSTNFSKANLSEATFNNVKAQQANFAGATLYGASIEGILSDFSMVNFSESNLGEAKMMHTNLNGSNFYHADCYALNVSNANLSGSSLEKADFTKAQFIKTNLTRTNLKGTKFGQSDLTDADLTGALTDDTTRYSNAKFCRTKMPDGSMRNDGCPK